MDINELKIKLNDLKNKIIHKQNYIKNEEMTKQVLILPFFEILGYSCGDPAECRAEYNANFGSKNGERVDYAFFNKQSNSCPMMIVETKELSNNLKGCEEQLFRYFNSLPKTKIGILTNGNLYKFYTDLEQTNYMDHTPFFSFKITEIKESQIKHLLKFTKNQFNAKEIFQDAFYLKQLHQTKKYLKFQLNDPDDEFIKFIIKEIDPSLTRTKANINQFKKIIVNAFKQITEIESKDQDKLNHHLSSKDSFNQDCGSIFYLKNNRGANAKGIYNKRTNQFTVLKDSKVADSATESYKTSKKYAKFLELKNKNIINNNNIFTQDYQFSSPSSAGNICALNSTNGLTDWKDKNYLSIKQKYNK